ncbi:hypothetical protein K525DRAFT_213689 [Schizophyllum commune Loenen D]|nr:hypothetical protein K525DRAFT_213689 [Schizophyllum commune Loenen D]
MIFAGDFAQLPPVHGPRLYDRKVETDVDRKRMSLAVQMNIIGKAIWHQVTTVVILSENMRMRNATPDDRAMATALANMRYAACTDADIAFLQSRVVGSQPGAPRLSDPKFRNVSIITARHAEKDAFNELGSKRFATETGQDLTSFYSNDCRASEDTIKRGGQKKRRRRKLAEGSTGITEELQKILWSSLPCFMDNVPGRLDLCRGMPVMIRSNIATELCMTKGQEAVVYDWTASKGNQKQRILDVLYVKLVNPPKTVKIDGLEENVVPLSRESHTITCQLPNDREVKIERSQVPVVLNFAMTDYASQGKTRPINIINLVNSRSHQAYYTALSRSSSASGTAIVSSFSASMISRGLDDQLKREFRNLEILNDINRLKYNGELPDHVRGDTRNQLIKSYLDWRGPGATVPISLLAHVTPEDLGTWRGRNGEVKRAVLVLYEKVIQT